MKMRLVFFVTAALLSAAALADSYTSPSGYLEIIGYRLQRTQHDGKIDISVSGSAMALADCDGAIMLFDVLDRNGNQVGTYKITHGEFFRHDGWALGPGKFTPSGADPQQAAIAADHIAVREVECTKRR
ncbi:MAG: hypothetical protein P8164_12940 [Gammaproteobacteria bacterium]